MFDDVIVVYKFIGDLMFFVTGSQDENELILCQVLQGFYESISLLLRCTWSLHNLLLLFPSSLHLTENIQGQNWVYLNPYASVQERRGEEDSTGKPGLGPAGDG